MFQEEDIDGFASCPQSNVKIVKVVPLPHARSEVWSYFGFIADDDGEIHDKKKTICRICATTLCYSGNTTNLFTHLKAMHPEVNPQKLAPTNKAPRTGKKSNKRKYFDDSDGNLIPIDVDSNSRYIAVRSVNHANDLENDQSIITTYSGSMTNNSVTTSMLNNTTTNSQPNSNNKANNNVSYAVINSDQIDQDSRSMNSQPNTVQSEEITDAIVNLIVRDCRPIDLVTGKYFEELIKLLAPNYDIPSSDRLEQLVKKKYMEVRRDLILKSMDDVQ